MNPDLLRRVQALEEWKRQMEQQQISLPLDSQSQEILGKYFMHIEDTIFITGGAAGNVFESYTGRQDEKEFEVNKNVLIPYTVDVTSNILTTSRRGFENDTNIFIGTEDTAPAPLNTAADYFVINSTGLSFQISATLGGAAIDITTKGIGRQYIFTF